MSNQSWNFRTIRTAKKSWGPFWMTMLDSQCSFWLKSWQVYGLRAQTEIHRSEVPSKRKKLGMKLCFCWCWKKHQKNNKNQETQSKTKNNEKHHQKPNIFENMGRGNGYNLQLWASGFIPCCPVRALPGVFGGTPWKLPRHCPFAEAFQPPVFWGVFEDAGN